MPRRYVSGRGTLRLIRKMQNLKKAMCSYCGIRAATDKEHVFPRNLYPQSKNNSTVQRLTIPSCNICNSGWSDDEVHFRNILSLSGEPNNPRNELWHSKVKSSFKKSDGLRRARRGVTKRGQVYA